MKKCPYCAEEIQDSAIKCKHCKEFLIKESFNNKYKICPFCEEQVLIEAVKCKFCGEIITTIKTSEKEFSRHDYPEINVQKNIDLNDISNNNENDDEIILDEKLKYYSNTELLKIIDPSNGYKHELVQAADAVLKFRERSKSTILSLNDKIKHGSYGTDKNSLQVLQGNHGWITTGYIFSVLGGYIGLTIGCHYLFKKLIIPSGQKIHLYDDSTRSHGKTMLFISVVSMFIQLILWESIIRSFIMNK